VHSLATKSTMRLELGYSITFVLPGNIIIIIALPPLLP
jgi:hypothetical protein